MKRRQYILGIGALGVTAGVAGCSGDETDDPGAAGEETDTPAGQATEGPAGTDTETSTDEESADDETSDDEDTEGTDFGTDPASAVSAMLEAMAAEDRDTLAAVMHSKSPFNPENQDDDIEIRWGSDGHDDFEVGTVETGVEIDRLRGNDSTRWLAENERVQQVFENEQTALVGIEIFEDGEAEPVDESRWIAATEDGEWRALVSGPIDPPESPLAIQAQVVEEISFEDDTATVQFLDVAEFEQATVETGSATTTVDAPESATVDVDPDGDTVSVTATVDGDQEEVHREGYPTDERFVDHIEIENEEMGWALVYITGETDADGMHVASANSAGEASTESLAGINYIGAGFEPDGDELVVTLTTDGEDEVVHRERFGGPAW